jgi:hypothetical protein
MERLSSGSRINRAKDDASGLSLRESANFLRIGFIYLKKT